MSGFITRRTALMVHVEIRCDDPLHNEDDQPFEGSYALRAGDDHVKEFKARVFTEARRGAFKCGWTRDADRGMDYCPDCGWRLAA